MDFIKVDKKIEEIVKTTSFLVKLKENDNQLEDLLSSSPLNEDNYISSVAICFYYCFLIEKNSFENNDEIFETPYDIIEKIQNILEENPEYWILWILKYKIISHINYDETELISNLETLIKLQNDCYNQPYFIVTEILLSKILYCKGERNKAALILEHILTKYTERILILNGFFKGFILEFKHLLLRTNDTIMINLVNTIFEKYFEVLNK